MPSSRIPYSDRRPWRERFTAVHRSPRPRYRVGQGGPATFALPAGVAWCFAVWMSLGSVLPVGNAAETRAWISTIAGTGQSENNGDHGEALKVNIGEPFGVVVGPDGGLYVTEVRHHRVRRVDLQSGMITTLAGNGRPGYAGDGGPATEAAMNEPYEVRFDGHDNLLVVEMQNHVIRRIDRNTRHVATIAGTGEEGFRGDGGQATEAHFSRPHSLTLDDNDTVYIADIGNHRIRRVDAVTGLVTTVVGSDHPQLPQAGVPAHANSILGPRALFVDGTTLWIALREGHSVWRMDLKTGIFTHVAGTGEQGYAGDGGPAREAQFNGPKGIAVQGHQLVVADTENQVIRIIDLRTGLIDTLAGKGPAWGGFGGDDGPAREARLDRPHGVCFGPDGSVYIGDTLNHRVRRVHKR